MPHHHECGHQADEVKAVWCEHIGLGALTTLYNAAGVGFDI